MGLKEKNNHLSDVCKRRAIFFEAFKAFVGRMSASGLLWVWATKKAAGWLWTCWAGREAKFAHGGLQIPSPPCLSTKAG